MFDGWCFQEWRCNASIFGALLWSRVVCKKSKGKKKYKDPLIMLLRICIYKKTAEISVAVKSVAVKAY